MVHTVGLIGAAGRVGQAASRHLAKAAAQGQIKLVLFHREGKAPQLSEGSDNIELRVVDIEKDSVDEIAAKVTGVQTMIATLGFNATPFESKLVEAFAKTPEAVTYVPSVFSTTYSEADEKDPKLGPLLAFLHGGVAKAKELGLPITTAYTGIFEDYWFEHGFMGSALKDKAIWANERQMHNPFPITALDHLGSALAYIGTQDPRQVAGKSFSAVTFWPTGRELQQLHEKLTGGPIHVRDYTDADREAQRDAGAEFGPAKAAYWDRWADNSFAYEGPGVTKVDTYDGPSLEEIGKLYA